MVDLAGGDDMDDTTCVLFPRCVFPPPMQQHQLPDPPTAAEPTRCSTVELEADSAGVPGSGMHAGHTYGAGQVLVVSNLHLWASERAWTGGHWSTEPTNRALLLNLISEAIAWRQM